MSSMKGHNSFLLCSFLPSMVFSYSRSSSGLYGDLNGDLQVTRQILLLCASSFYKSLIGDVNKDRIVDVYDLSRIGIFFSRSLTSIWWIDI